MKPKKPKSDSSELSPDVKAILDGTVEAPDHPISPVTGKPVRSYKKRDSTSKSSASSGILGGFLVGVSGMVAGFANALTRKDVPLSETESQTMMQIGSAVENHGDAEELNEMIASGSKWLILGALGMIVATRFLVARKKDDPPINVERPA